MAKMSTKKHPIEVLLQRIAEEPPVSQEEIARIKAECAASEPTTFESAYMDEKGEILIKTAQYSKNGTVADGWYSCKSGDKEYKEALKRHGPLKPGQGHTIVQELVSNKWVDKGSLPYSL